MPGSKRICRQCLNDDRYLNNIIASDPDASESCDYCDSEEMTMSMETLAEKVDWLIENYYRGGEYNHYLEEYEGEPLFSVLEQEVTVNDNIINDLSELLEELFEEPQAAVPANVATAAMPATKRRALRFMLMFMLFPFFQQPLSTLKLSFEIVVSLLLQR